MKNNRSKIFNDSIKNMEPYFKKALDGLSEGFIISSPQRDESGQITDFIYLYVNDAIANMAKLGKEEFIGRKMSEIIPGFLESELFRMYKEASENCAPRSMPGLYFKDKIKGKEVEGYFDIKVTGSKDGITITLHDVTEATNRENELKKTTESLRKNEEDFRLLFDNSFDALFLTEPDGKIAKCNSAAEKLFGFTEEEFRRFGRDAITDFSDPNLQAALTERERTGKFIGILNYKKKDGTMFQGEVSSKVFKMDDGTVRTSTVVKDITERLKAEKEIKKTSKQLQDIIDGSSAVIFAKDLEGRFILINRRLEELLGTTNEELRGKTDFDLFPKEWAEYYQAHDRKVLELGGPIQIEEESDLADGLHHTFMANKFPLIDEYGNPYAVCAISTDITDYKKMELELRESETRLIEAQKLAHVGSYFTDYRYNPAVSEFSEELFRIFGIDKTKEVLSEKLILSRIHPDDLEIVSSRNKPTSKGMFSEELEYRIVLPDNSIKHLFTKRVVVFDENGKLLEAFGTTMDITARKLSELKLRDTLEELERSNKELEQFAYIASHDLQEPLRMITSFTKMLEMKSKGKLDEKTNEYMWYITDGAKRMSDLINDLLSYSRLSSKAEPFIKMDLNSVISEVLRDLQLIIAETNTKIEADILPELKADRIQMKQLFQNLIQNAVKFRNKENPLIRVTVERKGKSWLFGVQDNGIGISPEHHDKIFMLFHRLHERDKYPGTGLGLAICKKIVELHGGRIWVESEVGKGTTFYFTIAV